MNTIDALNSRYCCRAFKPEQVSKQKVEEILEAAIHAPSWANTQPWEIYVASGEPLERLRKAYWHIMIKACLLIQIFPGHKAGLLP